ncbi:hypothetical protein [Gordonia alkanivorans]|nr:hypothetical protein [Gordonia alkanivorans]
MFDGECAYYVYFDNDPGCTEIDDARNMIRRAQSMRIPVATPDATPVE